MAAGSVDSSTGFTLEVADQHLRWMPAIDSALSTGCEYLMGRIKTIGTLVASVWIEDALGFEIPAALRSTALWWNCVRTAWEVMILQNDLGGADRDTADGDVSNAVVLLREQHGLSTAAARRRVAQVIGSRISDFRGLERSFPGHARAMGLGGQDVAHAQAVLSGLKTMSQGILLWYETTARYTPAPSTSGTGALPESGPARPARYRG